MEMRLAKGQAWHDEHARITVRHAEFLGLSMEYLPQMPDDSLAACVAVADVVVTIAGKSTRPIRVARPPGYGMPTSFTHRGDAESVLTPRLAYAVAMRELSRDLVVTLDIAVETQPADAEIDDFSQLPPADRAFIEEWGRIAHTATPAGDVIARGTSIDYNGTRLTRIFDGVCTLNPLSTGALDVTFWRGDDGAKWFVHAGGCIAFRSMLYGPYK